MSVITIARETGSEGDQLGQDLAVALGYQLLNKEIIGEVARKTGASEQEIAHYDEKADSWLVRLLSQVFMAHPDMAAYYSTFAYVEPNYIYGVAEPYVFYQAPPKDGRVVDPKKIVQHFESIIREVAAKGNVVILGRASQCVLAKNPDAFHIRTVAPLEWRIRSAMKDNPEFTESKAREAIERNDRWRERYLSVNYSADWRSPYLYHATFSMDRWERTRLVATIKAAVE